MLDPVQTTYDKRAFYVLHDVTKVLRQGDNVIGMMLGNGFYGQNIAFGSGLAYGEPRVTLVLSIKFSDGTEQQIVTDESWRATQGPVLFRSKPWRSWRRHWENLPMPPVMKPWRFRSKPR